MRYIIFDVDETIGYFAELNIFVSMLLKIMDKESLSQNIFNNLCLQNERMFRPGIFKILSYINKKKKKYDDIRIIVYSNNSISKKWIDMICNFISFKLHTRHFFDKVIGAYKIDDIIVERCRSSYKKSVDDLLNCICPHTNSTYLFIDDKHHSNMNNDIIEVE